MHPKNTFYACFAAIAATAALDLQASAATYAYRPAHPTYTAPAGTTVPIDIYLQESLLPNEPSPLTAAGGLFSAAFSLSLLSPPTAHLSFDLPTPSPAFTGTNVPSITPTSAKLYEDRATATPPGVLPSPDGQIFLGTVLLHVGTVNTTHTLRIHDFDPASVDTLSFDRTVLDPLITPAEFTVTVIPEPALLGLAVATLTLTRRRRNR